MIHCDNQACVEMINSMRSRHVFLQACLRELWLTLAVNNIMLKAVHIPGHENTLADCLSRWHTDAIYQSRFHPLTVSLELQPVAVNPPLQIHADLSVYFRNGHNRWILYPEGSIYSSGLSL